MVPRVPPPVGVEPLEPFAGTAAGRLSVEDAGAEMKRPHSGARLNLPLYLKGETNLEILARSVLVALGKAPDEAERASCLAVVQEAANDPDNHPLDCECEGCA